MGKSPDEIADEILARQVKAAAKLDPLAWRHPLAEAVMDLLTRGEPITRESLIARLQEGFAPGMPMTNPAMSAAAIAKLTGQAVSHAADQQ